MTFGFLTLQVNDMQAMAAWYRDVLGLEQNHDSEQFMGFVAPKGFFFNMVKREAGTDYPEISPALHLGFDVPTFEAVDVEYARLTKNGAKSYKPPQDYGFYKDALVTDPEGNVIYIHAMK